MSYDTDIVRAMWYEVVAEGMDDGDYQHLTAAEKTSVDSAILLKHVQGTDITIGAISIYANNAAAVLGGLSTNNLYRTGGDPDTVCVVH